MKRLFFLAVLLGTMILTGIFAFSYWRLKTKTPESYFELGKKYYEQGKFSAAQIEFLNALKRDGSHRDSRYYLALTYLSLQDVAGGSQQLRTLIEAHPDDVPAKLKLGNLYVTAGLLNPKFFEQAKELAQQILDRDPKNVQGLILAGNAYAGSKQYPEAIDFINKAIEVAPQDVSVWISLGSTYARQGNFVEAEKAFLKARATDPKDKSALISLANFYRLAGSNDKAESILNQAVAQYPADREVYSQLVDFYAIGRRFNDIEKLLRSAQAASPNDPGPTIDLADFYQVQKRTEDARKVLLEAKAKFPKSVPLAIKLASNLMPDKPDQAKAEIDQILEQEPNNASGNALLGEYEYKTAKTPAELDRAEQTFARQIGSPIPGVHYLLGNLALRKGRNDEAQQHFQRSIQLDPKYIPGRAAILNGLLLQNRLAEARSEVKEILVLDPGNMPARLVKVYLDMNEKNYVSAESSLAQLVKEYPDNFAVHRQFGLYYASRGRNADAEQSFLRAMELASNSEQSVRELTQFYLQTHQADRAMQKLNSLPETERKAYHYELMGVVAEQAGRFQDAEANYKIAIEKDPARVSAEVHLFEMYVRNKRTDEAMNRLDTLEKKSPSLSVVHAMKGTILQERGDLKGAEQSYRKALEIDPASDLASNNLAYILSHEGRDLQTALQLAEGARRRQPVNADVADTLGWVYFKLANLSLAKSQAEFAVSKQPNKAEFQYHLGEIYRGNGDKQKAAAAFRKAANSSEDFDERSAAIAGLKEVQK